ncbi:unnamed protein product [Trichobilharzia regenti]|nr:unnamed protein product [Trichobilharzia regenti]
MSPTQRGILILDSGFSYHQPKHGITSTYVQLSNHRYIRNPYELTSCGRSIHRNIIVQNTYSTDINITKVQLHPPNVFLNKIDNGFTKDIVKFHNIKQESDNDSNSTIHSIQPITFSPNQSVLIGTVYFDLSDSCMDHSVTTANLSTVPITSQAVKPYCYCGFSLDTSPGFLSPSQD